MCVIEKLCVFLQVLFLLLLAMPEALSREAVVDVPLASSLLSLPFYLLCLFGSALHVLICTSAGGPCYLCSLPWVLVFAVILFSSAFMCALVTMAERRIPTSNKTPTKVSGKDRNVSAPLASPNVSPASSIVFEYMCCSANQSAAVSRFRDLRP